MRPLFFEIVPKIAVFDSGLGSLSIISPIRKKLKSEIIYFADQENYPYGTKSMATLDKIIRSTISRLQERFHPDVIIVGSNTPSLLLEVTKNRKIIGVYPPLKEACRKTKSGMIAILATRSVVESSALSSYIRKNVPNKIKVIKVNASALVDLVESGKFISEKEFCKNTIRNILGSVLRKADVATLSSTHLPFLLPMLKEIFPDVSFLDPADSLASQLTKMLRHDKSKKNTFKIFASGDIKTLQRHLHKIGISNKVNPL